MFSGLLPQALHNKHQTKSKSTNPTQSFTVHPKHSHSYSYPSTTTTTTTTTVTTPLQSNPPVTLPRYLYSTRTTTTTSTPSPTSTGSITESSLGSVFLSSNKPHRRSSLLDLDSSTTFQHSKLVDSEVDTPIHLMPMIRSAETIEGKERSGKNSKIKNTKSESEPISEAVARSIAAKCAVEDQNTAITDPNRTLESSSSISADPRFRVQYPPAQQQQSESEQKSIPEKDYSAVATSNQSQKIICEKLGKSNEIKSSRNEKQVSENETALQTYSASMVNRWFPSWTPTFVRTFTLSMANPVENLCVLAINNVKPLVIRGEKRMQPMMKKAQNIINTQTEQVRSSIKQQSENILFQYEQVNCQLKQVQSSIQPKLQPVVDKAKKAVNSVKKSPSMMYNVYHSLVAFWYGVLSICEERLAVGLMIVAEWLMKRSRVDQSVSPTISEHAILKKFQ